MIGYLFHLHTRKLLIGCYPAGCLKLLSGNYWNKRRDRAELPTQFDGPSPMEPKKPFKSTVSDLIKYEFLDPPPWRDGEEGIPSTEEMIDQIIDFQEAWSTSKTKIAADRIENVQRKFREKYCDINTDPLKDESGRVKKQQESSNVGEILEFLDKIVEQEKEQRRDDEESKNQLDCGLIEKSMVQNAHIIAVKGINISNGCTQPGEFSNQPRYTTYKGEMYWYPKPDDMVKEVDLVLDRFNSLVYDSTCKIPRGKTDERQKLKGTFKSLAWFLFEILDLHPFGNGNGRLFRSFCYYVLLSFGQTVVPCPIYYVCDEREKNDHSACRKPCKDCYEQALVNARESATRHPQELATMLIESCWRTWDEFMEEIQKCAPDACHPSSAQESNSSNPPL